MNTEEEGRKGEAIQEEVEVNQRSHQNAEGSDTRPAAVLPANPGWVRGNHRGWHLNGTRSMPRSGLQYQMEMRICPAMAHGKRTSMNILGSEVITIL